VKVINILRKYLTTFAVAFVLVIVTAAPVQASSRIRGEALTAGHQLAEIMDLILTQYVGEPVTILELKEAAIRGMTEILDEYSIFLSADEMRRFSESITGRIRTGIGIRMALMQDGRAVVATVFSDSPAYKIGMLSGDVLMYIDGESVEGMSLDLISAIVTNPETERVTIEVDREGESHTFDILKEEIVTPTVTVHDFNDVPEAEDIDLERYRLIHISSVGLNTGDDLEVLLKELSGKDIQGIILDLRGNTGGYLEPTVEIANMLVPRGIVLQTVDQSGDRRVYSSNLRNTPFSSIVVLVDRFTASAAEVIASALQDSGATVVGETTFGKGLVQSVYGMRTGGALKLTTEEYFRRSGESINEIGVIPDVIVENTPGIRMPDAALRAGIEVMLGISD
jgi:carboxyl-terminal processing protease